MKTTDSGSSRIDVQQIERLVVHNFQNMGVPADENFGTMDSQLNFDAASIVVRIPSDVGHHDRDLFAVEKCPLLEFRSDFLAVDIAVNPV